MCMYTGMFASIYVSTSSSSSSSSSSLYLLVVHLCPGEVTVGPVQFPDRLKAVCDVSVVGTLLVLVVSLAHGEGLL